jgi:diguanylate cyclase (GGDEF)-like protein/PAS domain S-box-containing protein
MGRAVLSYRSILVLAAFLLTLIFVGVALFGFRLSDRDLEADLASEALRLQTAYQVSQTELELQMVALAGMIASDTDSSRLLKAANSMVAAEGGASGGAGAAQLRQQLFVQLVQSWGYLQKELGVRQMQFVLPGTVSFLRFHAPGEHGDSLHDVRLLLRDAAQMRTARSGFETGRAYAGIRGVAPVFDGDVRPGEARTLLGVVELGVAFDGYIQRLSEKTGDGFGVLLEPFAVTEAMWEVYRPSGSSVEPNGCCYLLAASREELADWMAEGRLPEYDGVFRTALLNHSGKTYQFIRFPLRDYAGLSNASRPAVGSIVIWQDVSAALRNNQKLKQAAALNIALAYGVTLALVLFLVKASRREWQSQLSTQTARVGELLHQNEVLLMTAGEGIFGVDTESLTTFVNPAALNMLGYESDELFGRRVHELIHGSRPDGSPYPEADCPITRTLQDGEPRSHEDNLVRRDGSCFPVHITVSPIHESGRCTGAVIVFRDITELKEKEAALTLLATTDSLTGLVNRRYFIEQLDAEIARWQRTGQSCALLMVDLDFFKKINDTWGHAAGDEVLKHFSAVLHRSLRRVDLPGRVGGEEFAVLLPDSDAEHARAAAERLRGNIENEPAMTSFGNIAFTVSIGVTLLHAGDNSADQPLLRADQALYRAKAAGRNHVEYE